MQNQSAVKPKPNIDGRISNDQPCVADVGAVATVIKEEVVGTTLKEVKESAAYQEVVSEQLSYDDSMARVRKSENTLSKNEADKRRDDAYVGTRKAIDSLTYSPDEAIRGKATKLFSIMNMYSSGVEKLPDSKESEYLKIIISRMKEPENYQMATEIGIKAFVDNMDKCESDFRSDWGEMENDKEEYRNSQSATNSRRKLEDAINAFYAYLAYNAKYNASKEQFAQLQRAIYSRYLSIRQKYIERKKKEADKKDGDKKDSDKKDTTPKTDGGSEKK
ncbi:DUF6261 family protein [uncultured Acetobacteroides sp.]|uniref:DUF6261 family protein n=1 Tax=uncultured Acetobacteroides sp. TaxID=1760811 RepID=UPI0029F542EA|nr:DUF6261 family protein [uncultured Acetobacteroides sp.]